MQYGPPKSHISGKNSMKHDFDPSKLNFLAFWRIFAASWCHKQVLLTCKSSKLFSKSTKPICTQDWCSMGHLSPIFQEKIAQNMILTPQSSISLHYDVFLQLPGLKINIRWLLNHPSWLLNQQNYFILKSGAIWTI